MCENGICDDCELGHLRKSYCEDCPYKGTKYTDANAERVEETYQFPPALIKAFEAYEKEIMANPPPLNVPRIDILSCPDCGESPELFFDMENDGFYVMVCSDCELSTEPLRETKEQAISDWNELPDGDFDREADKIIDVRMAEETGYVVDDGVGEDEKAKTEDRRKD